MYKFLVSFVQVETLHSCPERDALSMLLTGLKREKKSCYKKQLCDTPRSAMR